MYDSILPEIYTIPKAENRGLIAQLVVSLRSYQAPAACSIRERKVELRVTFRVSISGLSSLKLHSRSCTLLV